MNASDPLENDISTIIEILSVLIALALSASRSRNDTRRMRAETVQRECTEFLRLLQDRNLEYVEDQYDDFWEQTMDNFEASNRYLKDLDMSNMSDDGTVSPEFEVWRKMSREYNNLLEWLPRLKQSITTRAKRSPSLSDGINMMSIAPANGIGNRPRVPVRHSFSDYSSVNTSQPPIGSTSSQMRSRTYPPMNGSQTGGGRRASFNPSSGVAFQGPRDAITGVTQGLSDLSVHENSNVYRPPYTQSNPSMNGSVRSQTQQFARRGSVDLPPNTIPIYSYPTSNSSFGGLPPGPNVSPSGSSVPVYNFPNPISSSPTNQMYNHQNSSRQSLNAYPTRPSILPASNGPQQTPSVWPATYISEGPKILHRTSSRQSINTSPTQLEPVPFDNESRPPPPVLRHSSSRHSFDSTRPLKGILKNGTSRTSSSDDYQSPHVSGFAPASQIVPEPPRHTLLGRSWSTAATVGSGNSSMERPRGSRGPPVTDRFKLPRFTRQVALPPGGASSSSTVPFLHLEHEPRSRYPAIPPPEGYQPQSPVVIVFSEKEKKKKSKGKDEKHHHHSSKSKESSRGVLTKSKDRDKEKKRHKS